jgi:hypothetical protein
LKVFVSSALAFEEKKKERNTPKGSRTPAACLEGKHDNRFTIGVSKIQLNKGLLS